MSDVVNDEVVEPGDEQTTEEQKVDDLSKVMGRLDSLESERSAWKKNEVGLHEAINKLKSDNEELQKESMSEKDRSKFELERERKKNVETAAELAQRELALERANIITELSIPKDLALFVQGKDQTDILSNAKSLMLTFNDAVLKEVNRKLATDGGPEPQTGDGKTPTGAYDGTAMQKIHDMPPGPDKDAAYEKAFTSIGADLMNF